MEGVHSLVNDWRNKNWPAKGNFFMIYNSSKMIMVYLVYKLVLKGGVISFNKIKHWCIITPQLTELINGFHWLPGWHLVKIFNKFTTNICSFLCQIFEQRIYLLLQLLCLMLSNIIHWRMFENVKGLTINHAGQWK